jgi:hypothetical protein
MSLTRVNMWGIVKKQYQYKLKSYSQSLMSLMTLQLLAIVFSLAGTGSMSGGSGTLDAEVHYYSADLVVVFTILWGFITAIVTTTKGYRYDDLVFISNRVTSNLSNTLVLLTASVVGGITSMLSTYLLKMILRYFFNGHLYGGVQAGTGLLELILGILTVSFYVLLFCGLGYLVGTLVQMSKIFVVLLPALIIGSILLAGYSGETGIIEIVSKFYFTETSLSIFIIKIIGSVLMLFTGAFILSNRMEVKQG